MRDATARVPAAPVTSIEQISEDLIRVKVGEREFEVEAACAHRKGMLAHGYVHAARLRITCPLHHSSYSLETGESVTGPTERPLCVREVTGEASSDPAE